MVQNHIIYFETDKGEAPFTAWLSALKDRKAAAVIKARIERLRFGLLGDTKYLKDDIYELRIHFGPGYRVYFTKQQTQLIILLYGGNKNGQRTDIQKAVLYCKQLKEQDYAKAS